jgi:hypothetical protein
VGVAAVFLLNSWLALAMSQGTASSSPVVSLPDGEITRIPSPDGKWMLVFECPHDCSERNLWIEVNATHARKLVQKYDRTLSVSWAPDSRHFFVNDDWGSNGASCTVYDPATLKTIDIATVLTAREPGAKRFLDAGHAYLHVTYWINPHEFALVLFGHFDDPPSGGFTFHYRVGLDGRIAKLSEQSEEHPE